MEDDRISPEGTAHVQEVFDRTVRAHLGRVGERREGGRVYEDLLKATLCDIEENDTNYDERYFLVFRAMKLAIQSGLQAGIRIDPDEPEWPVAYIELPTGQVSWHMPQHTRPWDGHDTAEKYRRIKNYVEG